MLSNAAQEQGTHRKNTTEYGANDSSRKKAGTAAVWLGLLLLLGMEFILHRRIVFMMDDLWYGTNLVTGRPLATFADVIESQIWHFHNWGGRNVTHGLLQLVLMTGELPADLLNLLMTMLLGALICKLANAGNPFWFLMAETLLLCFGANVKMSMFWQSGTVNYVYSTVWLLFFLWVYLRELTSPDKAPLPGITLWILPLGLAAGWSNENMGPACALTACAITLYLYIFKKQKTKLWMHEGIVMSVIGSILVIIAPGNFVRVNAIEKTSLGETLFQRVYAMLCATGEFLFPTLAILFAVLLIYICFCEGRLEQTHMVLLLTALAAHGAMILSPHYPDRATFGVMTLCITVTISLLKKMWEQRSECRKWIVLALTSCFVYTFVILIQYILYTDLIVLP